MGLPIGKAAGLLFGKGLGIIKVKPQKLHGINPVLVYPKNGKSFELPRFCTEEMQTALKMNKTAIKQVKTPSVKFYPEADAVDLKRLTSTSIEDSYSRVEWTNPKDGKVYNLLKQGETEDGKVIVRILNENGGFIKEARLTPKVIGIPDNYTTTFGDLGLTHGEMTNIFAKRNNPFAKYVPFNISRQAIFQHRELDEIFEYVNKGGKLDYLSCSYGGKVYLKKKISLLDPNMKQLLEEQQGYDRLAQNGTRILNAAGNASLAESGKSGGLACDILTTNSKAEGVGSLNPATGKISDFSLSRNSNLTQHYEVGEFMPSLTPDGVNITGLAGTDMGFVSSSLRRKAANPLLGKSVDKVQHLSYTIDSRLRDIQTQIWKLFKSGKSADEIMKEKALLEEQKMLYSQRKRKLFDYANELRVIDGKYQVPFDKLTGTSISTPVRTAKLALNDMMEGVI